LLPGNLDDPFFSRLAQDVKDNSRKEGVKLMVCSGSHQAKLEKIGLNLMIYLGCEAIGAQVTRMKEVDILRYAAHTLTVVVVNQTCRLERNVLSTTVWPWLAPASSSPTPRSSVPPFSSGVELIKAQAYGSFRRRIDSHRTTIFLVSVL